VDQGCSKLKKYTGRQRILTQLKFITILMCVLFQISFLNAGPLEAEIFTLTNQMREKAGLNPLQVNSHLMEVAKSQSSIMALEHTLSHSVKGDLVSRINRSRYSYRLIGENIAESSTPNVNVVQLWMTSDGHRENILNPTYKDIGIGIAVSSDGVTYYTQVFGSQ